MQSVIFVHAIAGKNLSFLNMKILIIISFDLTSCRYNKIRQNKKVERLVRVIVGDGVPKEAKVIFSTQKRKNFKYFNPISSLKRL